MILVRDIFHQKYGKAKEAVAIMKEAMSALQKTGYNLIGF